jgi:uncharacterized protein (DUF2062 family)
MNSVDWKLEAKALGLGLLLCSKFLLALIIGAAIISTIVTFIGWQIIPIIIMIGIVFNFAWMMGHLIMDKKKREELKKSEESK